MLVDYFSKCLFRAAETSFAMLLSRFNPRVSYFNDIIHLMRDNGIYEYILRRYLPYKDIKEAMSYKEEKLTAEHLLIPNIVLIVGMLSATMLHIAEKYANAAVLKCSFVLPP